ncbi:MAG: ABC transporter substrate-binding protein [Chloroflexi bacterium]|nr:ABC transporter substrate-binding protein [Chloroflexota bacterium]
MTYYFITGAPEQKDLQLVQDAVNAILQPKINATMTLKLLTFSDLQEKSTLMLSSGAPLDLITVGFPNPYPSAVATGGLQALDDLLPKYAPQLWSKIPQNIWGAARVNGKIYMAINQPGWVSYAGFWARQSLTDKYNFDWKSTKKLEDWEPYFDQILKGEPGMTPVISSDTYHGRIWFPSYWKVDSIDDGIGAPYAKGVLGVRVNDQNRQVFAAPTTDEFRQSCTLARKWHEKGYFAKDLVPDEEMGARRSQLKYAAFYFWGVGPFSTRAMGQSEWHGETILSQPLQDKAILTTSAIQQSGIAVAAASKNPERAVAYIEEVNSNPDLYNTLNYGVQGKHWVWVDEANKVVGLPPGVTLETIGWNANAYWEFGDRHLLYPNDPADIGVWDRIDKATADAIRSPLLGFSLDRSPIQNEAAQVATVAKQYGEALDKGLVDPDDSANGLAVYNEQLKAAGIDKIVQETQKQVDAWAQAQPHQ